ncbi:protein eyes shut homolog [Thalassophryne amazonica]|uniref:protein eyes shut homolog n=1 Tax=Thalassophryne amazonica TaxID=390379 RepID=UPI001472324F|nr:protein eyes shut homolog [Thalassophryne amazonica]
MRPLCHIIALFSIVVGRSFLMVYCQTVCNRRDGQEWHIKQHTVRLNWTLTGNICSGFAECWATREAEEESEHAFNFPQICPLQLQHGDKLLMFADETLKKFGIKIFNVHVKNFESCSTDGQLKEYFFSPNNANGSQQVDAKWLTAGHHYFIALHEGDTQLCKFGLRLNITVKMPLCRPSPLFRLCSGNGICKSGLWEQTYHCQCHRHYSGRFCEKFDACLDNPCENKGVCLSKGSTDTNHRTYTCLCPPHFTGVNCSEIIGRENCERICQSEPCVQVSPTSFRCTCDPGISGKRFILSWLLVKRSTIIHHWKTLLSK